MDKLVSVHGYVEGGVIAATFEEVGLVRVIDDPASPFRQLLSEWEAEGNTIPPYVTPELPFEFPRLEPHQFHAMVLLTGYAADIESAIQAIENPFEKASALSKYHHSTYYKRLDPFVVALGAGVGLTPEILDGLWLQAIQF